VYAATGDGARRTSGSRNRKAKLSPQGETAPRADQKLKKASGCKKVEEGAFKVGPLKKKSSTTWHCIWELKVGERLPEEGAVPGRNRKGKTKYQNLNGVGRVKGINHDPTPGKGPITRETIVGVAGGKKRLRTCIQRNLHYLQCQHQERGGAPKCSERRRNGTKESESLSDFPHWSTSSRGEGTAENMN